MFPCLLLFHTIAISCSVFVLQFVFVILSDNLCILQVSIYPAVKAPVEFSTQVFVCFRVCVCMIND